MLKKFKFILVLCLLYTCIFSVKVFALENNEFSYIVFNDEIKINSYLGNDNNVIIPETINDLPVTEISQSFYCKNSKVIDSLFIPKSVKKIGTMAIENWNFGYLQELLVNEFIVDKDNKNLASYNGDLYTKGYDTLLRSSNQKNTEIHEDTKVLLPGCFNYNYTESITISKNIQNFEPVYLEGYCEECNHLKEINVVKENPYLYSIDGVLFKDNILKYYPFGKKDETYVVPEGTIKIGTKAFYLYENIKNLILPESMKEISSDALEGCSGLETINIPSQLTNLWDSDSPIIEEAYLFRHCTNLKQVTVSKDNPNYTSDENALYRKDYSGLVHWLNRDKINIILDQRVKWIGQYAFMDFQNLQSIDLQNVNAIGMFAFYNCNHLMEIYATCLDDFSSGASLYTPDDTRIYLSKDSTRYIFGISGINYVYSGSEVLSYIKENNLAVDYKIINEQIDKDTKIQVDSGTCNNIDETAILKVSHVTNGDDYNIVSQSFNQFEMYDIGYYKNSQSFMIDGTAIVKIPVGKDMSGNKCKIYYYDNGKYKDMNAIYKEGYMIFKTRHFSQYILTEEMPEVSIVLGDINEDGEIDFLDSIMILRNDAEFIKLNDKQIQSADVNKNGSIDFLDAIQILRYDAELINGFD